MRLCRQNKRPGQRRRVKTTKVYEDLDLLLKNKLPQYKYSRDRYKFLYNCSLLRLEEGISHLDKRISQTIFGVKKTKELRKKQGL